jgi:hypothetical protein
MKTQDFTTSFLVDQTPEQAFAAINNVRGWWGEGVEGGTEKLGDAFIYRHKDLHRSTQKLVEVVPGKKVVWLVTDANLSFAEDKAEWKGTKVVFEISRKGKQTEVRFTHQGLVPEVECYEACSGGWTFYLHDSLKNLIATGKGQPDPMEVGRSKKAS